MPAFSSATADTQSLEAIYTTLRAAARLPAYQEQPISAVHNSPPSSSTAHGCNVGRPFVWQSPFVWGDHLWRIFHTLAYLIDMLDASPEPPQKLLKQRCRNVFLVLIASFGFTSVCKTCRSGFTTFLERNQRCLQDIQCLLLHDECPEVVKDAPPPGSSLTALTWWGHRHSLRDYKSSGKCVTWRQHCDRVQFNGALGFSITDVFVYFEVLAAHVSVVVDDACTMRHKRQARLDGAWALAELLWTLQPRSFSKRQLEEIRTFAKVVETDSILKFSHAQTAFPCARTSSEALESVFNFERACCDNDAVAESWNDFVVRVTRGVILTGDEQVNRIH